MNFAILEKSVFLIGAQFARKNARNKSNHYIWSWERVNVFNKVRPVPAAIRTRIEEEEAEKVTMSDWKCEVRSNLISRCHLTELELAKYERNRFLTVQHLWNFLCYFQTYTLNSCVRNVHSIIFHKWIKDFLKLERSHATIQIV